MVVVPPAVAGAVSPGPVPVCDPPCVRIEQGGPIGDGVVDSGIPRGSKGTPSWLG